MCIDTHVWTVPKVVGKNKEKEICLLNKEYTNCHWWEITRMSAKCKIFMNSSKKFIVLETNMTAKWGIFNGS